MEVYIGKGVCDGTAIGRIWFFEKEKPAVRREYVEDEAQEWERYVEAKQRALEVISGLHRKAKEELGEEGASIFEAHALLLEDMAYNERIRTAICEEHMRAECAAEAAGAYFAELFAGMENEYFQARAADIRDVTDRVTAILTGRRVPEPEGSEPVILVAAELSPSETVQLDAGRLLGLVTEHGSQGSHTAILARTMGLPALTGISVRSDWNGKLAALDGKEGILYVEPEPELLKRLRERQVEEKKQRSALHALRGQKTVTADGRSIRLCANIGSLQDLEAALEQDAEGIGLFRSELLYLEKERCPTEEEQFCIYREAARRMQGRCVVIRTLDIGADKQAGWLELQKEENPAMGLRGVRLCLERPALLKTQLRAIFRASVYGNVAVMFPMITSMWEVRELRRIAEETKEELAQEQIACRPVEFGIMIETPAAALISDALAEEVDFFSIGTNDLSQYTMAVDRQNAELGRFFDPSHPAVLRMIQMSVENGHRRGCSVAVCGDLAADPEMAKLLVQMGVDELSVPAGQILPLRAAIRQMRALPAKE